MSTPKTIFIDTSVFDEQCYNFQSSAIKALLDATSPASLTLLIPDPTEREIKRHIKDQVESASKVLEDAKRKAPLLAKWKGWPIKTSTREVKWELSALAETEWNEFLKQFDVRRLNYEGIDLPRIMNWYEFKRAPFGVGKKSKEFPDALAIAALALYASSNKTEVAVVSKDQDFKKACGHYSELLHFSSLAALTEAILSADKRVAALKELLASNTLSIAEGVKDAFPECSFYPEEEPQGDVEHVAVDDVELLEFNIVSLGDCECKIAFRAWVSYSALVTYDDPDSLIGGGEDGYFALRKRSGTVSDSTEMSGVAKLTLSDSSEKPYEVALLEFDYDDVCVNEVPEIVTDKYDWHDDDY